MAAPAPGDGLLVGLPADCAVIGHFAAGQDKAERASLTVTAGVDLARKAAAKKAGLNQASDPVGIHYVDRA